MAALRVLSIAVASSKASYVYLQGGLLIDWGISVKAAQSGSDLVGFVQALINRLRPDIVVTERCGKGCRKGGKTKRLINAASEIASHNEVLDVSVPRPRCFATKYDEAAALAEAHPEIAGSLPKCKRRYFDYEPRGMVLFEALALAKQVIEGPTEQLAAAMG